jgi:hypothetical protein
LGNPEDDKPHAFGGQRDGARQVPSVAVPSGAIISEPVLGNVVQYKQMAKHPIKIEVLQEGDERFLLQTFADGSEERNPIVKLPRKPPRFRYRKVTLNKSRKKGF